MGCVTVMCEIQDFMDDLKTDANHARKQVEKDPRRDNIRAQVADLMKHHATDDAPMEVHEPRLEAAFMDYMQAIADAEVLFVCRVEAATKVKPAAA